MILVYMVTVVQLVRMSDCGSEGRRFDPDQSPQKILEGYPSGEGGDLLSH